VWRQSTVTELNSGGWTLTKVLAKVFEDNAHDWAILPKHLAKSLNIPRVDGQTKVDG
jgi:hypothetical protein